MTDLMLGKITNCARCGGTHDKVVASQLKRPMIPPELPSLRWTHWFPCPETGEPVMVRKSVRA